MSQLSKCDWGVIHLHLITTGYFDVDASITLGLVQMILTGLAGAML